MINKRWLILKCPNTLSFPVLCLFVPHQGSALDLLGGLQCSADLLLISSCLRCEKKPLAFYKLNLEHKNCVMTKCLEKTLKWHIMELIQYSSVIKNIEVNRDISRPKFLLAFVCCPQLFFLKKFVLSKSVNMLGT